MRCARALRRGGFGGSILIIGEERLAPYNRPPLSKELLLSDEPLPDDLLLAEAQASADGVARAHATALYGMGGLGRVLGNGDAAVELTNSGEVAVVANAAASGGNTATALGIAVGGFAAIASGQGVGDAGVAVINSGSLLVGADVQAVAATNAQALAIAVTGVYDIAHARTGDASVSLENSGSIAVVVMM